MTVSEKTRIKRHKIANAVDGYAAPDFEKIVKGNPNYNMELTNAMNYSAYVFEAEEQKSFAKQYARGIGIDLSNVPSWELVHLGTMSWLLINDAYLANVSVYTDRMKALEEQYKKTDNVVAIVSAADTKTHKIIGELEGILDDMYLSKADVSPLEVIESIEGRGINYEKIHNHFKAQLDQINDPEFAEAYENVSAANKKKMIASLTEILKDLEKFLSVKKSAPVKAKKIRIAKPKKVVPSKLVRKLIYLKEFPELNLKSIQAEKIIGASVVWVYNTKTRKLGQYIAKDGIGIMAKGSTLLNYDETLSVSKTLRKPQETLDKLNRAGKVEQRKLLEEIRAVGSVMNGRINKDTILVKVY